MLKYQKIRNIAAAVALAAGGMVTASAAPVFQVDPNVLGLATQGQVFSADGMNGNSAVRIARVGNTFNYTGTGYIQFGAFTLNDSNVSTVTTRNSFDYILFARFTQSFTCDAVLSKTANCTIAGINLSLYGDIGNDNKYVGATVGSDPTVTTVGAADVLLGTVNAVLSGSAGINDQGGAYQNVNTNFNLTDDGKLFFIQPKPFYSFAFSSFNNTSQGLTCLPACGPGSNGEYDVIAVNQESGFTDFNGLPVPEPESLTLLGLGLLGLAAARRKAPKA